MKKVSRKVCPKCRCDMEHKHRVNKNITGVQKGFWACRCGWLIDDGQKEGYWPA